MWIFLHSTPECAGLGLGIFVALDDPFLLRTGPVNQPELGMEPKLGRDVDKNVAPG